MSKKILTVIQSPDYSSCRLLDLRLPGAQKFNGAIGATHASDLSNIMPFKLEA